MSENQNDAQKKWEDKLYNMKGKTLKESEDELNKLWKEQQLTMQQQELRAYKKIKKRKQILSNQFIIDETQKQDIDKVPIDGEVLGGSRIFMRNCGSCHSLETRVEKWQDGSGPSLARIFGKPAASNKIYTNYTDALIKSKIFWNSWNLYNWVHNPQAMVNGTKCMAGSQSFVESQEDRADIVMFIRQFSKQMNIYMRREMGRSMGSEHRDYTQFAHEKAVELMKKRVQGMQLKENTPEAEEREQKAEDDLKKQGLKELGDFKNKKKI